MGNRTYLLLDTECLQSTIPNTYYPHAYFKYLFNPKSAGTLHSITNNDVPSPSGRVPRAEIEKKNHA
jgi:hypothetical protein